MFCNTVLCGRSSFSIISLGKRELVALFYCDVAVSVLCLYDGLQSMIVAFHLLFVVHYWNQHILLISGRCNSYGFKQMSS